MKKLTLKIVILLAGAAVLVPTMASAAEPTTGQKPCELDRTIKVQMKYRLPAHWWVVGHRPALQPVDAQRASERNQSA